MNHHDTPTAAPQGARLTRWLAPITLAAAAALLAACGGGGGSDDGGNGPAVQGFASGRIEGFGSIIVNGVRFDDSGADVSDDDGGRRGRDDLRLGMVVDISSGGVAGGSADATQIVVHSEIKGPVEAVDVPGGRLTVLGQTVIVDAATVFDDSLPGGLADLVPGELVEVYAFLDRTTGTFTAARIEDKNALDFYKLRGTVTAHDPAAQTFKIGDALIGYGSATERPATIADGMFVKVKLQTVQQPAGVWVAVKVEGADRRIDDDHEAELEGLVSDFVNLGSFKVGGIAVDARNATIERGTADMVQDGAHVEVEGMVVNGVLVARKLKFEDDGDDDHDDDDSELEVEIHGAIETADAGAKTFVVRGITVRWSATTRFDDGLTGATLSAGQRVEVEGELADNGTVVAAERIKLDD